MYCSVQPSVTVVYIYIYMQIHIRLQSREVENKLKIFHHVLLCGAKRKGSGKRFLGKFFAAILIEKVVFGLAKVCVRRCQRIVYGTICKTVCVVCEVCVSKDM